LSAIAKFGLALLVGGIVYSLAQTVVALQLGSVLAAVTAGGMTMAFCGFLATLAITWFATPSRYAASDDSGTTLRINPYIAWCYGVTLIGAAVGSACYLAFISRGVAELPLATPGRGPVTRYLMVLLLILSLIGLVALLRRRGVGYLRIGPDGVETADIFRTRTARWGDVIDVTDRADNRARNPVVFLLKDTKAIIVPNADRYEPNFGDLYWMVRHYWKHPEVRDELTDGRALDRLRNERFDPE
jgi:hypothetical protein